MILAEKCSASSDVVELVRRQRLVVKEDLALRRIVQTSEQIDSRGFTRAVHADDDHELTRVDGE